MAFLLTPASTLWSSETEPISVNAQVDLAQPTLGDILTYTITVTHDPDIALHMPEYEIPEGFEKVENGEHKIIKESKQKVFWLKLRIDKTGPLTLPAIPVWFDAPGPDNKMVQGKIMTPEVKIEVQSLLQIPGSPADIKDIKPLAEIKAPWIHYVWIALGVLCLLGVIYWLWKKRRKKSGIHSEPTVVLTSEQIALKELAELQKQEWMKLGRISDHFFELSEIFRRYLESRYRFPAQEWTTEEILTYFKKFHDLSEHQKLQARAILSQSDKVKFAKAEVAIDNDQIEPVIRFINEVTPPTASPDALSLKKS